jgi:hypothetical protein
MNLLGAPVSRRPVGSRKPKLAGETPALPGIVLRFKGSKREFVRGILSTPERKRGQKATVSDGIQISSSGH